MRFEVDPLGVPGPLLGQTAHDSQVRENWQLQNSKAHILPNLLQSLLHELHLEEFSVGIS
jgi:hypothetical protein